MAKRPEPTPAPVHVSLNTLLGGLTVKQFLAEYWQKKPLLIRQAVPGFQGLLPHADLLALARDEDVESRLVSRKGGKWQLQHGPQSKKALKVKGEPWTVLVQGLNLWLDEADRLLRHFAFIPYARLDDLMVSYATDGGGVGPHFDDYDVFLLQGTGQRRWQIANQEDHTLEKNVPLKILKNFQPVHDWTLNPGDMLYLPPNWAHNGIAVGDGCTTYSIGFRSPSYTELGREFLYHLAEAIDLPGLYADPDLKPQTHPARIGPDMTAKVARALAAIRWTRQDIADFLGRYLSEPKPTVFFDPPEVPLSSAAFAKQIRQHGLRLHRKTLMLWTDSALYINGETLDCDETLDNPEDLAALRRLADERCLPPCAPGKALARCLHQLYADGFLLTGERP